MRGAPAALAALALLAAGCRGGPLRHDGPVVLITLEGLRADVVGALGGEPGLTPHLDRLMKEADWAGRAVSASSWTVPAMASLWTGLRPGQHGAVDAGHSVLPPDLLTLPEALKAAGYRCDGFSAGPWLKPRCGYARGCERYREIARGWQASMRLAHLDGGREFVWLHLPEPAPPLVRRDRFLSRVPDAPPHMPARVPREQLEPFFDPAVRLPRGRHRVFWSLYRLNVAWADERLGGLLDALRRSGQWDRTLLVVASDHGEEFGERGQILDGGNLGRHLIEVPLAVKLPAGFGRRLALAPRERPALARLWATLVEAAGGPVPPAVAPSLFRRAPGGALSELYGARGTDRLSLVEGDRQLLWEAPAGAPRLISGGGPPGRLTLELWEGPRGSRPVDQVEGDRSSISGMAARLAAACSEFQPVPGGSVCGAILANRPPGLSPWVHSSAVRASGS
jgi:sulfatase-like protein